MWLAPDGEVRGVDHGVCFNLDEKLRTVLWGWAGEPVPAELLDELEQLRGSFDGALGTALREHLARREVSATLRRLDRLVPEGQADIAIETAGTKTGVLPG